MTSVIVLLAPDKKIGEKALNQFEEKHKLKNTAFAVYEGEAGPKNYKIAKDAEVTVMMWAKRKIAVNHAFAKGKLNSKAAAKVAGEANKIIK